MTAQDLTALADKLDELAMKATPDAWYVSGSGDRLMCYDERVDRGNEIGWLFNSVQSNGSVSYGAEKDNAKLIVALRNALPQITTALREAARLRGVASNADRAMRFVKLVASQRLSEQAIAWYGGEFGEDGEPDFEGAYDSFIEQARSIWSDIERAALESPRG